MEAYSAIEKHASDIVERLAMSKEEKHEMKVEFFSHMQASKEDFEAEGYSEKEAEKLAISHFGKTDKIADDMHEALFPYRSLLFLILAALSLFTAFGVYLLALFVEGDAYYGSLITAVLSSTAFLLLSEGKHSRWEKKGYLATLLIIHGLLFLNQAFIPGSMTQVPFLPDLFSILSYTIILFAIVLIYMVALTNMGTQRSLPWLHAINITIGLLITLEALFFLWASLAFGGGIGMIAIFSGIPLAVWIIAYVVQIQLMKHSKKKSAYLVLALLGLLFLLAMLKYVMGMMQ